jgi:predicted Fe-Mo cluster-binding NifX family protein
VDAKEHTMMVAVPVANDGQVDPRWGRAHRVALARLEGGEVVDWSEHEVAWDELHDSSTEGSHHARIARFLLDHHVDAVVAGHMGPPMMRMLDTMGVQVHLGAAGSARDVIVSAVPTA